MWFGLNRGESSIFLVPNIREGHEDNTDQDYLGGPVPPLAPSWPHHCVLHGARGKDPEGLDTVARLTLWNVIEADSTHHSRLVCV